MRLFFFNIPSDLKCGNTLRTHTRFTDNKYEKIDYTNKKQPSCCDLKDNRHFEGRNNWTERDMKYSHIFLLCKN